MIQTEREALQDVTRDREAVIEEKREQEREERRLEEMLAEFNMRLHILQNAARDHRQQVESLLREVGQRLAEVRTLEDRARGLKEDADR